MHESLFDTSQPTNLLASLFADECNREPKDGEYRGDDGLIYCSVCKTPKQVYTDGVLRPKWCDCMSKKAEAENAEQQRAEHERTVYELRAACFGSGNKYAGCTFEGCDTGVNEGIIKSCQNYCYRFEAMKKEAVSLILCGGSGRGKTHTAACICNQLIEEHEARVRFMTETEFIQGYEKISGREDYLKELSNYSLLVIDEFGLQSIKANSAPTGFFTFFGLE